ncbi:MAG: hypothetical protein ACREDI_06590 [Roseiarcus sp.]
MPDQPANELDPAKTANSAALMIRHGRGPAPMLQAVGPFAGPFDRFKPVAPPLAAHVWLDEADASDACLFGL